MAAWSYGDSNPGLLACHACRFPSGCVVLRRTPAGQAGGGVWLRRSQAVVVCLRCHFISHWPGQRQPAPVRSGMAGIPPASAARRDSERYAGGQPTASLPRASQPSQTHHAQPRPESGPTSCVSHRSRPQSRAGPAADPPAPPTATTRGRRHGRRAPARPCPEPQPSDRSNPSASTSGFAERRTCWQAHDDAHRPMVMRWPAQPFARKPAVLDSATAKFGNRAERRLGIPIRSVVW